MTTQAQMPVKSGEFIALIAVLFATIAISIDAMLPALPEIATALSPENPNHAQLVITSFVLGMGIGTLFVGPISDAIGRKTTIILGFIVYVIGAIGCYFAPTLEMLLLARVLQGMGAAAPRVVSLAMVRDLYSGSAMARVMSFAMMIFVLVPAVAPLLGAQVIAIAGWRDIFLCYVGFSVISMGWMWWRQPETLAITARRPLAIASLFSATKELFTYRIVVIATLAQALTLGALFGTLSSMQGIFDVTFGRADSFPKWFAFIALASMLGSILNAKIVVKAGMQKVVFSTYVYMSVLTVALAVINAVGVMPHMLAFPAHLFWSVSLFAMMGLTMGNLNALAMEPVGHIAGLAASVSSSIATVAAVLLAIPLGLAFDGTAIPLMFGVAALMAISAVLLRRLALPRI